MDFLATRARGRMLVVDYKSDRVDEQADLEEIVERDYAIQRQLYALAVLRTGAREVQVAHWFLARPAEHAEVRYTQADVAMLESALAQRLSRARTRRLPGEPASTSGPVPDLPRARRHVLVGRGETLRETPAAGSGVPAPTEPDGAPRRAAPAPASGRAPGEVASGRIMPPFR